MAAWTSLAALCLTTHYPAALPNQPACHRWTPLPSPALVHGPKRHRCSRPPASRGGAVLMGGAARIEGERVEGTDNFYEAPMEIDGEVWLTCEHYFQAAKFSGDDDASVALRERIRLVATPMGAWELGQSRDVPLRRDWEKVKGRIMYVAVAAKYAQHPQLAKKLVATTGRIRAAPSTDDWQEVNAWVLEVVREEHRPTAQRDDEKVAVLKAYIFGDKPPP